MKTIKFKTKTDAERISFLRQSLNYYNVKDVKTRSSATTGEITTTIMYTKIK